jgi:hypothetical protein
LIWHRCSRAWQLSSHRHGAPTGKAIRAINWRHRYVRQKASVARLLVILKIHPAQLRQPQRRPPRAIDRRPKPNTERTVSDVAVKVDLSIAHLADSVSPLVPTTRSAPYRTRLLYRPLCL